MKKLYFLIAIVAISFGSSAFTFEETASTVDATIQAIEFKIVNNTGADLELFFKRGDMEKHATIKNNQTLSISHVPGTVIYKGKDSSGLQLMEVTEDMAGKGFMAKKLIEDAEMDESDERY